MLGAGCRGGAPPPRIHCCCVRCTPPGSHMATAAAAAPGRATLARRPRACSPSRHLPQKPRRPRMAAGGEGGPPDLRRSSPGSPQPVPPAAATAIDQPPTRRPQQPRQARMPLFTSLGLAVVSVEHSPPGRVPHLWWSESPAHDRAVMPSAFAAPALPQAVRAMTRL